MVEERTPTPSGWHRHCRPPRFRRTPPRQIIATAPTPPTRPLSLRSDGPVGHASARGGLALATHARAARARGSRGSRAAFVHDARATSTARLFRRQHLDRLRSSVERLRPPRTAGLVGDLQIVLVAARRETASREPDRAARSAAVAAARRWSLVALGSWPVACRSSLAAGHGRRPSLATKHDTRRVSSAAQPQSRTWHVLVVNHIFTGDDGRLCISARGAPEGSRRISKNRSRAISSPVGSAGGASLSAGRCRG